MATIKFGKECDRCFVKHDNYDVQDIAECQDCNIDLCDKCAGETAHYTIREWDEGQSRLRGCDV